MAAPSPAGGPLAPKSSWLGPPERDGIKLGETSTQNANQIIGLGFQNFKTHIYVNSSNNLIKDNWFGLSDDGTDIALRAAGKTMAAATPDFVTTEGQYEYHPEQCLPGFARVAAAIIGDNNTFANNYVSTTANGTVPANNCFRAWSVRNGTGWAAAASAWTGMAT